VDARKAGRCRRRVAPHRTSVHAKVGRRQGETGAAAEGDGLDGAACSAPDTGTAQGSVLSPLLGNIYLHYVLDLWFEREIKPRLRGEACLVRYSDDFAMTFELQDDARRVMDVLGKRMAR